MWGHSPRAGRVAGGLCPGQGTQHVLREPSVARLAFGHRARVAAAAPGQMFCHSRLFGSRCSVVPGCSVPSVCSRHQPGLPASSPWAADSPLAFVKGAKNNMNWQRDAWFSSEPPSPAVLMGWGRVGAPAPGGSGCGGEANNGAEEDVQEAALLRRCSKNIRND